MGGKFCPILNFAQALWFPLSKEIRDKICEYVYTSFNVYIAVRGSFIKKLAICSENYPNLQIGNFSENYPNIQNVKIFPHPI